MKDGADDLALKEEFLLYPIGLFPYPTKHQVGSWSVNGKTHNVEMERRLAPLPSSLR